ncbi:d4726b46-cdc1-450c-a04c-87b0834723b3 [Sclerotinia trifoliorum]|uniref:Inheritance of peroxisomes protein 1 n=1 Tax=Sclerotinia trifoliorum TaxID=28548 RepID=A0A8H2W5Q2_9HELO|nr:d4726b46-cdc1-450c-a04c-87b0834723b3 [Sclerotinia trifoliorum]
MALTPSSARAVSASGRLTSIPDPQIEILYSVDGARIISFSTPPSTLSRPSSSNGSAEEDTEIGCSLRWSSPVERTIAVGTLRIYRAPESVAFLNCQKALKPILPRSQCWFISDDGSSKFVLQVRKLQEYWRIEIRNTTPEEIKQVEEFKRTLAQVLLYEKTPCPFQRTFSIDLPIVPQIPAMQKPWRPVQRSSSRIPLPRGDLYPIASKSSSLTRSSPKLSCTRTRSSSPLEAPALHQSASCPTKTCTSDLQTQEETPEASSARSTNLSVQFPTCPPQNHPAESHQTEHDCCPSESVIPAQPHLEFDEGDDTDATDDTNVTPRNPVLSSYPQSPLGSRSRSQALQHCSRSITAPPVLSLITSPPSKRRTRSPVRKIVVGDPESELSSSVESFHSTQSWHSPLDVPPSPPLSSPSSPSTFPYPHDNIILPKKVHPTRTISQLNVTPEVHGVWQTSSLINASPRSLSPAPRTPTLISDGGKSEDEASEIITPPPPKLRNCGITNSDSSIRTLSPLPSAVNLFSPPPGSRRLQTARHLPTAIIQKTCEILLSPPSHLLHIMMNIASKIAAGEWRGVLLGEGEAVHWDFTEDEYHGETWTEDDFGFRLTPTPSRRRVSSSGPKNSTASGESWELD